VISPKHGKLHFSVLILIKALNLFCHSAKHHQFRYIIMLWLKAFHLITIICWFAGIFYLPRLFVYHAMAEDQATRNHLKIMERKLYRFVSPFAVLTIVFGILLIAQNPSYYVQAGWLQLKVLFVIALIAYHLHCGHLVKKFADDKNQRGHVFYRWFNEVPVIALFATVLLAVLKPF
jgi:putative membrane protein